MNTSCYAEIPIKFIGPIKVNSAELTGEFKVPMATLETPLWPSCNRGAKVSRATKGINVAILKDQMTRSVYVQAPDLGRAKLIVDQLALKFSELSEVVAKTSRFAKLQELTYQIIGNLIYIRMAIFPQDAAGHNMATLAADQILTWILANYPELQYGSISANYCTDKKVSAVNGILGRGKYVVAEILIPQQVVLATLKTTPAKIVDLHIKKNLLGSILAGSIRTANAHFANMLLAIYLATGQDAANIVEGSQGIVHTALQTNGDLYFSVTLPNIIVGTVGNGKDLAFVQKNLQQILPGELINARQLAGLIAASVLCGELSLLAAQTNPGELVKTHMDLERGAKTL